jgi:hypothetical protein
MSLHIKDVGACCKISVTIEQMAKSARKQSYFWAKGLTWHDLKPLTFDEREGVTVAALLADDALFRRECALRGRPIPPPLTIGEAAKDVGLSPQRAGRLMRLARSRVYGELTDRAIYARRARARAVKLREVRYCEICAEPLPLIARTDRKTCSGRCRKRRADRR